MLGKCRWYFSCSMVGSRLRSARPLRNSALVKGACGRFLEVRVPSIFSELLCLHSLSMEQATAFRRAHFNLLCIVPSFSPCAKTPSATEGRVTFVVGHHPRSKIHERVFLGRTSAALPFYSYSPSVVRRHQIRSPKADSDLCRELLRHLQPRQHPCQDLLRPGQRSDRGNCRRRCLILRGFDVAFRPPLRLWRWKGLGWEGR